MPKISFEHLMILFSVIFIIAILLCSAINVCKHYIEQDKQIYNLCRKAAKVGSVEVNQQQKER